MITGEGISIINHKKKISQCGINYIKLTHNLHSVVNQFNSHEARDLFFLAQLLILSILPQ